MPLANVAQLAPTLSAEIGLSLQTKFNATILIDPSYPQELKLLGWVKSNKSILSGWAATALSSRASGSFSTLSTPLIVASDSHKLTSIAEMTLKTFVGIFNVEAKMSISDEFQKSCVLEGPGCNKKRAQKTGSHLIVQSVCQR